MCPSEVFTPRILFLESNETFKFVTKTSFQVLREKSLKCEDKSKSQILLVHGS